MANKLHYDITAKDRTKRVFSALGSSLKKVGKAVFNMKTALVGLAGIAGLGLLVRASLKSIDNLGKLSRQIFISTEDLGAFRLASELGGTSLEAFAKGARTLAVGINDFLVKGTGIAKEAFEQLGITADDLRSTNGDLFSQFEMVAEALSQLKDGTDKTAIAYKLFGGRNIELLTALEGGAEGMKQIKKEAEKFGLTLSAEMVAKVELVNDSIGRMVLRFKGLIDQMTVALAPALLSITNKLVDMFDGFIDSKGGVETFSRFLIDKMFGALQMMIMMLGNVVIGIENFFNQLKHSLRWTGIFKDRIAELTKQQEAYTQSIKHRQEQLDKAGKSHDKLLGQLNYLKSQLAGVQSELEGLNTGFEITQAEGKTTTQVFAELVALMENWRTAMLGTTSVWKHATDIMGEMNDEKNKSKEVIEEIEKVELTYMEKMQKAYASYYKHKQIQDRKDLAFQIKLKEQGNKQLFDDTKSALSAVSGLNRGAFEAYKRFQIAEATINAYQSASQAFKTYANIFPANIAIAGMALVKGMAMVAQIKAQTYSGKRMGGGVREGTPYMVGEAGRELFVPNQSGNIVANDQLGRNVNVNFHIETVDAGGFDQLLSQRRSLIVNMINSAVNEQGKQAIV